MTCIAMWPPLTLLGNGSVNTFSLQGIPALKLGGGQACDRSSD
jgi:hypothetical protein